MPKSAAELRAELAEAEAREKTERDLLKQQVPIQYRYEIAPQPSREAIFDKVYDPTCVRYRIVRRTVNPKEAEAAGHPDWELQEGGMTYVFNTGTNRIICSVSGGTIYISGVGADAAFEQVGNFLAANPQGGDITDIVERFQAARQEHK